MDRTEIESKIREIVAGELGIKERDIHNCSSLENDLAADSLDMVELIMHIEEEFDIEISDDKALSIKNVQDLIDLVSDTQDPPRY